MLDGKLYVKGRSWDNHERTALHHFDPLLSMWETIGSPRLMMTASCVAALDGKFYVAGGHAFDRNDSAAWAPSAAVEVYEPSRSSWTAAAAMTEARQNAGAAVVGGKLYVAGG